MKSINGKVLFLTLMAAGAVAAMLGIAQIWLNFLDLDVFIKVMATIVIVGGLAGFLMAVDYDMPGSREKYLLGAMVLLAVVMGGLTITQLWWLAMEWVDFAKIFGTVLILFILVCFVLAVKEDFTTGKKLRDDNYID